MKKAITALILLNSGGFLIRYGLVATLIWIGILKFTQYESDGIRLLAEHSPFFSSTFAFISHSTFIVSTLVIIQEGWSSPFLSSSLGQFLIKDLILLRTSLWTAGEALAATQKQRPNNSPIKISIVPTYNKN